MATSIFVNLPVKNLDKTKAFFTALGYNFNPQFTNESAACMVISDTIFAMLLTEPFFQGFTDKQITDTQKSKEVLLALSTDSREGVDDMVDKAIAAGGNEPRPALDHGFMYTRSFDDLDGHTWEIFWMNPNHVQ
jgi:uncharacterized protein